MYTFSIAGHIVNVYKFSGTHFIVMTQNEYPHLWRSAGYRNDISIFTKMSFYNTYIYCVFNSIIIFVFCCSFELCYFVQCNVYVAAKKSKKSSFCLFLFCSCSTQTELSASFCTFYNTKQKIENYLMCLNKHIIWIFYS